MRYATGPLLCILGVCLGCTSHDPDLDRVGGPIPDANVVLPDGASEDAGSDSDAVDADAEVLVPFCEAFKVMKVCRRCHATPPNPGGAPFALQRWEDTQQIYLERLVWVRMIRVLEIDFMPLLTLPIEIVNPPIQPLDPTCKNTLLTWLRQGAKPEGGTDCNPDLSCEGCPNFP